MTKNTNKDSDPKEKAETDVKKTDAGFVKSVDTTLIKTAVPGWAKTLPDCLANKLGLQNSPRLVGYYDTVAVRGNPPQQVQWYAFRTKNNKRLPHFYAAYFEGISGKKINLYEIGAVGNRHQVDILLTDKSGNPLYKYDTSSGKEVSTGLKIEPAGGGGPKPAEVDPSDYLFHRSCLIQWLPQNNAPARFLQTLQLDTDAGDSCILWIVSYRGGSREKANCPFPIPEPERSSQGEQDDDGSPGDGVPGGE